MAIYHLHVKVIGRKAGSSAVASAAYRSASRLRDARIDRVQDFSAKRGVVHSEVLLPDGAPEVWRYRERLWNDVEAFELRKDAQLAREVEFALPREMSQAQGIALARDFVQSEFVDLGMVADLNVHWDRSEDGMAKPHAHVMLTMRSVDGRDDFADGERLVRTLLRDRAKDMASDYARSDPVQDYAERRGITFRQRVVEIVRKVPEKLRDLVDGLKPTVDAAREEPSVREALRDRAEPLAQTPPEDPEAVLRRVRTSALIRHARAWDAILTTADATGQGTPEQLRELSNARKAFDEVRPHGWRDAEAAYEKNPELVRETAGGTVNRAIRALQLETEIRTDPERRADRFVERWQKLDRDYQRQYQAGDMSGYKVTRVQMGDMARSLERDPQLESLLANRKKELGISLNTGRSLGRELAHSYGIDFDRSRGLGL
ncbi:MAG TPA: MobA/MobL family protein [Ancylobacter sp.]